MNPDSGEVLVKSEVKSEPDEDTDYNPEFDRYLESGGEAKGEKRRRERKRQTGTREDQAWRAEENRRRNNQRRKNQVISNGEQLSEQEWRAVWRERFRLKEREQGKKRALLKRLRITPGEAEISQEEVKKRLQERQKTARERKRLQVQQKTPEERALYYERKRLIERARYAKKKESNEDRAWRAEQNRRQKQPSNEGEQLSEQEWRAEWRQRPRKRGKESGTKEDQAWRAELNRRQKQISIVGEMISEQEWRAEWREKKCQHERERRKKIVSAMTPEERQRYNLLKITPGVEITAQEFEKRCQEARKRANESKRLKLLEETPEERQERLDRRRFWAIERKARMTEEDKEARRQYCYLHRHATVARMSKEERQQDLKRKAEYMRNYMRNLPPDKKAVYYQKMNENTRKYYQQQGTKESWLENQRKRTARETPEERMKRLRGYKINAARRKLEGELEGEGVLSQEEIRRRCEELVERMRSEPLPPPVAISEYKPRPAGRKPKGNANKRKEFVTPDTLPPWLLKAPSPPTVGKVEIPGPSGFLGTILSQIGKAPDSCEPSPGMLSSGQDECHDEDDGFFLDHDPVGNCEVVPSGSPAAMSPDIDKQENSSPQSPALSWGGQDECYEDDDPIDHCDVDSASPQPILELETLSAPSPPPPPQQGACTNFPQTFSTSSYSVPHHTWICPYCSEILSSHSALRQHFKQVHTTSPDIFKYTCMKCPWNSQDLLQNRRFKTAKHLRRHVQLHHPSNFWPCPTCNLLLYSEHRFNIHFSTCSSPPKRTPAHQSTPKQPSAFMCELCGKYFHTLGSYKCHSKYKHHPDQLICPVCSVAFSHTSSYWKHFVRCAKLIPKVITNEGPPVQVPKPTPQKKAPASGPIPCDICGKSFAQKCTLDDHIRRDHEGNLDICPDCGRILQSAGKLWRHQAEAHGKSDLPPPPGVAIFRCKYCQEFIMRGYEFHVKKKHPEKMTEFRTEELPKIKARLMEIQKANPKRAYKKRETDDQRLNTRWDPRVTPIPGQVVTNVAREKVRCQLCGVVMSRKTVKGHMNRMHTGDMKKMIQCPKCDGTFRLPENYEAHFANHHAYQNIEEKLKAKKLVRDTPLHNKKGRSVNIFECLVCNLELPSDPYAVKVHFLARHYQTMQQVNRES